jgi:effector-binding domain-containing protein
MTRPRLFRLAVAALPLSGLLIGTALAQTPPATPAPSAPPAAHAPGSTAPASPATPDTSPPATPGPQAAPPTTTPVVPTQTADPFGVEVTLEAKTVVLSKGNATWDSAFETLMDSFKALTKEIDKLGGKVAGNMMIVYTSTDDTGFTYQAEVPVEQEPKNLPKTLSMGKSPDGKALKFVHRGSYDNMDNTYEAITNHLDDKKLEAKDTFIEEYVTDPLTTAEDKLVINVYVPLK